MQTWESACYTSASGECRPVTSLEEKHENILSDKFSTIENLPRSSHDPRLIAPLRKKVQNWLQNSFGFDLIWAQGGRIFVGVQHKYKAFELSFAFLGLWLPKFTQIPTSGKKASPGCPGHGDVFVKTMQQNICGQCVEHVLWPTMRAVRGLVFVSARGLRPLWGVLVVAAPPAPYPA